MGWGCKALREAIFSQGLHGASMERRRGGQERWRRGSEVQEACCSGMGRGGWGEAPAPSTHVTLLRPVHRNPLPPAKPGACRFVCSVEVPIVE